MEIRAGWPVRMSQWAFTALVTVRTAQTSDSASTSAFGTCGSNAVRSAHGLPACALGGAGLSSAASPARARSRSSRANIPAVAGRPRAS